MYHPSIERYLELERGHLKGFKKPPKQWSGTGGGIRKWPGGTGGEVG